MFALCNFNYTITNFTITTITTITTTHSIIKVDIYGAGGSPMDGNDNSRVILSPFAPSKFFGVVIISLELKIFLLKKMTEKNQKDSARDMTTVNFFDDEEL